MIRQINLCNRASSAVPAGERYGRGFVHAGHHESVSGACSRRYAVQQGRRLLIGKKEAGETVAGLREAFSLR